MADDKVIASSEDGPVTSAASAATITSDYTAADIHKRKLEDLELNNVAEPVSESENKSNPDALDNDTQEEETGVPGESECKRPRLESNEGNDTKYVAEDVLVSQNGKGDEERKDESQVEEPEQPKSAVANVEHVENQEPPKEPVDQESPKELVDQDSPKELVDQDSPKELVDQDSPKELVDQDSPKELVDQDSPKELVDQDSPKELVDQDSLKELVDQESPIEPVDQESPKEPVDQESPKEPVDQESPKEPVDQEFPKEPVDQESPKEPVDQESPKEPFDQEPPKEPVDQEPPKESVDQEPHEAPLDTVPQELACNENEKTEIINCDEFRQRNAENELSSELPREGDIPVYPSATRAGLDRQILSRKMEVPNDKVGVLIGKAGDNIRSLQDNSGAKIQIMRDADADIRSSSRPVELVGTLEDINKAEKLIKDVIAEANAGGSPSLIARGFNTAQASSDSEQVEIQVSIEKVGLIIGKGGETIRNLQTKSGARIQLIQQNHPDGEQPKERTVRISGYKRQIDTAREMIKDVMNQTVRPSSLSGGYSQQGYRPPHGPVAPQWGPRGSHHGQYSGYDYPQRGTYSSQNSQYPAPSYGNYPSSQPPRNNLGPSWEQRPPASMHGPSPQGNYNYGQQLGPEYGPPSSYSQPPPQSYSHGYNEAKYDNRAPPPYYGPQPAPYSQGSMQSSYGPPQDQYGRPPLYGMQQPPQVPYSQPYIQPRPSHPGDVPYQGPTPSSTQPYGQNMLPQQAYAYPPQQPYPPSYGPGPTSDGCPYGHPPSTAPPGSGYGQPVAYSQAGTQQQQLPPPAAYPQSGPTGGYGPVPQPGNYTEQSAAAANYGYHQGQPDPAAYGVPQGPTAGYPATGVSQAQPGYDQSSGYGNVPAQAPAAIYGKSASPQAGYAPPYDATQAYGGGHR